ncbi:MAG: hypothetical protein GY854_19865 [Deltaproteobacteria bacterium]|nr:hypothetical protein [Deltaproteobacteria bacterium]
MADSENIQQLKTAVDAMNRISKCVRAYDEGKVILFNGMEVPFSTAQINAMKQDYVATKATLITALNAITG